MISFILFVDDTIEPKYSDKLLEYGINIASGWGGECISVKKNKDQRDVELVYDYDKEIA